VISASATSPILPLDRTIGKVNVYTERSVALHSNAAFRITGNFKEGHYFEEALEVRFGFALDGISEWGLCSLYTGKQTFLGHIEQVPRSRGNDSNATLGKVRVSEALKVRVTYSG
jgi:hypothetical protein